LGQPGGSGLAAVEHHRQRLLRRSAGGGSGATRQPERKILEKLSGRTTFPTRPPTRLAFRVGRRGGKDRAASILAAYLAALVDWRSVIVKGEAGVVLVAATNVAQARIAYQTQTVFGDRIGMYYTGDFGAKGLIYSAALDQDHPVPRKADNYLALPPLVSSRSISLVNNERMIDQLCCLSRRPMPGGYEKIEASVGQHDDISDSVALSSRFVTSDKCATISSLRSCGPTAVSCPIRRVETNRAASSRGDALQSRAHAGSAGHFFEGKTLSAR
jgi:hypothetical protein